MGAALASAALGAGHAVTLVVGPVATPMPLEARRIDIATAAQMYEAVLRKFPFHDLLIMAAAVADFRPKQPRSEKLRRGGILIIECEPTADIVAAAAQAKTQNQRIVGFSLEMSADSTSARNKLVNKQLDLIVQNPLETMTDANISAMLLWPDGRCESPGCMSKERFAELLIQRATELF